MNISKETNTKGENIMKEIKIRNKTRNTILKTLAYIMGVILFLSMSALDSESLIPFCLTCISGAYLAIYAYANKERFGLTR
jgi:FtsH-binding integral membrane protein